MIIETEALWSKVNAWKNWTKQNTDSFLDIRLDPHFSGKQHDTLKMRPVGGHEFIGATNWKATWSRQTAMERQCLFSGLNVHEIRMEAKLEQRSSFHILRVVNLEQSFANIQKWQAQSYKSDHIQQYTFLHYTKTVE